MRKLQAGLLGLAAAVMMTILPSQAYAYTESEKSRAKAWLSSHGYPATKAGAYQAYDDWMNGEWWDEFGPPEGMGDDDDETKATAVTQKDRDADKESEMQKGGSEKKGGDSDSGKPSEDSNRTIDAIAESSSQIETSSRTDTDENEGLEDTSVAAVSLEDMVSIMSIFVTGGSDEEVSPVTQRAEESTTEEAKESQGNYLPTIFGGMIALALILLLVLRKKKH